ncbi:MAG: hypothetical protein HC804_04225 [Anaerolineae bacterium]|nr:hypothetical protein [Anaerolineae bacterium]
MDYWITYLAVLTIALEMALMMVGYLANPRALVNRVFALFMLALVVSTAGTILLVTAPTFSVAAVGAWLHAAAIFSATPLLALLLLHMFAPSFRYLRQLTRLLVIFLVIALLLLVGDVVAYADLVYQFDPTNYVPGYVSLADYLTGLFGPLLYFFTVQSTHVLFPLLILLTLLKGIVPSRQRRAAWRLLLLLFLLGVVNGIVLWKMPVLLSLVGSLSVAFIATWGIVQERVLSPMQIGERQALDTAMFGILLFDEQGKLLEWNRTARRLLLLEGEATENELSNLLTRLAETAVNRGRRFWLSYDEN